RRESRNLLSPLGAGARRRAARHLLARLRHATFGGMARRWAPRSSLVGYETGKESALLQGLPARRGGCRARSRRLRRFAHARGSRVLERAGARWPPLRRLHGARIGRRRDLLAAVPARHRLVRPGPALLLRRVSERVS